MAILGIIGMLGCGGIELLQIFVDYVEKKKISKNEGGVACSIDKVALNGENELNLDLTAEERAELGLSEIIIPNKVVFIQDETGDSHTLFAMQGKLDDPLIKRSYITISRIARSIIGLFALDLPLDNQFELFDLVRYLPKSIYICLTKIDSLDGAEQVAKEDKYKAKIEEYFKKRRIMVTSYFKTVVFDKDSYSELNDNAAKMILDIALGRI